MGYILCGHKSNMTEKAHTQQVPSPAGAFISFFFFREPFFSEKNHSSSHIASASRFPPFER